MNPFKSARIESGLKQYEVAKQLKISHTTVSMWESGASLPNAHLLKKIAALYGCTVDELLREEASECREQKNKSVS